LLKKREKNRAYESDEDSVSLTVLPPVADTHTINFCSPMMTTTPLSPLLTPMLPLANPPPRLNPVAPPTATPRALVAPADPPTLLVPLDLHRTAGLATVLQLPDMHPPSSPGAQRALTRPARADSRPQAVAVDRLRQVEGSASVSRARKATRPRGGTTGLLPQLAPTDWATQTSSLRRCSSSSFEPSRPSVRRRSSRISRRPSRRIRGTRRR
jgi:hypothetical protein